MIIGGISIFLIIVLAVLGIAALVSGIVGLKDDDGPHWGIVFIGGGLLLIATVIHHIVLAVTG